MSTTVVAPKQKALGLWRLTALVAGNMIGSGIFLLPASLAHFGSISILAWILTALGSLCLALVFAKLSTLVPKVGGPYAYCREAYGDFVGFQVAYNYWIALWVGNAAIALALVGYLSIFFPLLATNKLLASLIAIVFVWLMTAINIAGVRQAGIVQLATTILKIIPLVLVATVGLFYIHPEHFKAFNISGKSDFSAMTGAAALTLWSFVGLESATVPAGAVDNPKKNIPRATILGTGITAIIYILSTIAIMGIIPTHLLIHSDAPYADTARIIFGNWGAWLIGAGAIISCFGALNGWTLLVGQVSYAAALDDLFPRTFAKVTKNDTPAFGLIVAGILITGLLLLTTNASLVSQFTFIILLAVLASLFPYLLTTMAQVLITLRQKEPLTFKKHGTGIIIAGLAFLYTFWAIMGSGQSTVYYGCLLLFSGTPIYAWMKWRTHQEQSTKTMQTME